ncbi:MAG: chromosomal replication initiator protein DnaA [Candidatus Gastranaerophilales bacterium]|nr:chromosomal replication initiator protein DnaA [Candidatus Gastranaerophilales bacterium]
MDDIVKIWDAVLDIAKDEIPPSTFGPWVLPLVPHNYDGNSFSVLSGQSLAVQIIAKNCQPILVSALKKVVGSEVALNVIYDEELSKKLKKKSAKSRREDLIADLENKLAPSKYESLKQMRSSTNLNLKYKFENFVVGENSKLAYFASTAVAKEPGKKYNPLFIYGGAGLGKTHLMQAIGHQILFEHGLKVKFVTTEEFLNDLINAISHGSDKTTKMNNFRDKYRKVDVLLIDDIQFLEGKQRTEIEVFNTFEALHNAGKQIVITSDRPPENIPALSDRLRSRFQWGLMVDIGVPDLETRMAILQKLARENHMELPFNVVEFLAQVYKNNVRELEGAFNKISAYSALYQNEITVDEVKKIIKYSENKINITIDGIIDAVAEYYNVSVEDLKGTSRFAKIASARQVAIYAAREITGESFPYIGEKFGKKHTTILYSYEKIKEEISKNSELSQDVTDLINKIND